MCGEGTIYDASTRKCEVSLGAGTEVVGGKVEIIGLGDFDGDGVFRLADAVFVSKIWTGKKHWPVAAPRRGRRSLESTSMSDDGVLQSTLNELSMLRARVKELEAKLQAINIIKDETLG